MPYRMPGAQPHALNDAAVARTAAARYLAATMQSGRCPADRSFDRFMTEALRLVSPEYWTPLAAVRRAATWLDDLGVRTVADIGSGAGKFCVAGALFSSCRFIGLEQYASLVEAAHGLAALFGVDDRVRFVTGALGTVPDPVADAYYFFNPFGEYRFGADHPEADGTAVTDTRYEEDIAAAEGLLREVPHGTLVLTYNGFGGAMPAGYETVHVDRTLRSELRLWRKRHRWRRGGRRSGGRRRRPQRMEV